MLKQLSVIIFLISLSNSLYANGEQSYFCTELLQTAQSIENLHCSFEFESSQATFCQNNTSNLACQFEDNDTGTSIIIGKKIASFDEPSVFDKNILKIYPDLADQINSGINTKKERDARFDMIAGLHCHKNKYSEGFCSLTQRKSMLVMISDDQTKINDQLYSELIKRATNLYQSK